MIRLDSSNLIFSQDKKTLFFNFNDKKSKSQKIICGMSLKKAGSLRFRWNEKNALRSEYFDSLNLSLGLNKNVVPVELIHSQIVYDISKAEDTKNLTGDGIITKNPGLLPTITVADCMPIFLWEPETEVFGIVHSGWKGTGIAVEAMKLAAKDYGAKIENFMVILGPHIESCCYIINKERALYFQENFGEDCVIPLEENGKCFAGGRGLPVVWNNGTGPLFRLSLEKANLNAIKKAGVKDENITVITDCTCCNEVFGSNRRETAEAGPESDKTRCFTVQAAFICRND